ncbi:hypothetical protein DMH27_09930 [Raoultella planticola]|uniref:Uncharacterized protein n=1 Tax=Raoultella planticola TaxID=575 RepID=A0A5P6A991_RAOPL|nr:hypothetical protein [Raoultella planticola]QFG76482.1 hypothetical protein DMB90_04130 [Raoultella planticola]
MKFFQKTKWLLTGGGIAVLFSVLLTNVVMLNNQRAQLDTLSHELRSRRRGDHANHLFYSSRADATA